MNNLMRKSATPLIAVIVAVIFLILSAVIAVSGVTHAGDNGKTNKGRLISIHDRGTEKVILSQAGTIGDALKEADIPIDSKDLVEPAVSEKLVASNYQVNIYRARTILVIDEAHNYLGQRNIFLQRIIREGRSKGIVVFFASQSPSDYQQKFFNFQELLEFAFIFQSEAVSASAIQDILGCNSKTAKDLQSEIARLEPFQVISRSNIKTEEFVKFEAEAFYKNY